MTLIFQINKILFLIKKFSTDQRRALKTIVLENLSRVALQGEDFNYENEIQICKKLDFITENTDTFALTRSGIAFLDLATKKDNQIILDSNEKQKKFITKQIMDVSGFREDIQNISATLKIDFSKTDPSWFLPHKLSFKWPKDLVELLFDSNFFQREDNKIQVTSHNSLYISKIKNSAVTEETLFEKLERQHETGSHAEELTIKHEKERLEKDGFFELALEIKKISKVDIYAGYDILSFNGNNSTLKHDRMIEVKGTSGSRPYFYWSDNEIKIAEKLKDQYWIYLWINVKSNESGTLYQIIQNPFKRLWEEGKNKPEPVNYLVNLDSFQ